MGFEKMALAVPIAYISTLAYFYPTVQYVQKNASLKPAYRKHFVQVIG